MNNKLLPTLLIGFFLIVLSLNFFQRDPEAYPLLRLIPFVLSISLGIGATLYAASTYGFGSEHGKALSILAVGMILTLLGDLIFVVVAALNQTIPYPSFADFLYILGSIFFLVGFIKDLQIYKPNLSALDLNTKIMMLALLLLVGPVIIYFEVFLKLDPTLPLVTNLVSISLGLIDLILLVLVSLMLKLSLGFGEGKFFAPWLAIFFAVVSSMIGNLVFSIFTLEYLSIIWPYTMINIFWVTSYLLVCFAFIRIGSLIKEAQNVFMKKS